MSVDTDEQLHEVLDADRIAVVGCSTTPGKDAHEVPTYLQEQGYEIVPVNPYADEVLGERAYDSVADVPGPIHVVQVFRPSEEVAGIVDEVLEHGDVETIWTQLGISDDEAAERAREEGIRVVQDRCLRVEHERLR